MLLLCHSRSVPVLKTVFYRWDRVLPAHSCTRKYLHLPSLLCTTRFSKPCRNLARPGSLISPDRSLTAIMVLTRRRWYFQRQLESWLSCPTPAGLHRGASRPSSQWGSRSARRSATSLILVRDSCGLPAILPVTQESSHVLGVAFFYDNDAGVAQCQFVFSYTSRYQYLTCAYPRPYKFYNYPNAFQPITIKVAIRSHFPTTD